MIIPRFVDYSHIVRLEGNIAHPCTKSPETHFWQFNVELHLLIAIPKGGTRDDLNIVLTGWKNIPTTKLHYYCLTNNWAFGYSTNVSAPSFYFTQNLNNITMVCSVNG